MSGSPHEKLRKLVNDVHEYIALEKEEGRRTIAREPTAADAGRQAQAPNHQSPAPSPPADAAEALAAIAARVAACKRCELCENRTNTVPGQGSADPELIFVGEGPGADEDAQGLAFVGRSGQLLSRMIKRMGMSRDEVWIGNIVKCRPPGNRTPVPEEMDTCMPYLKEQLAILKPKVIVCLGATAVKGLLQTKTGITKLRGTWMSFEGIDVMPTYHPSYLLRSGGEGNARFWEVWEDLCAVLERLGRPIPEKESEQKQ